ncbi:MAG TPA: threonine synthase [Nitrososphaerales archaeon]|jgi:threonine synthase|nr:threonine synthase [Nitrososphaerales archaeon]
MGEVSKLVCRECNKEYTPTLRHICDECFGPLDTVYDYDSIDLTPNSFTDRVKSLWRYIELLPLNDPGKAVDLGAGFTPLHRSIGLGERLGLKNLFIKNDSVNPSFSFKDRPATVAVSKSLEFNLNAVGCPSTGNLAAATAAHAARAQLPCYIFVPSDIEPNKIVQASAYGAQVVAVKGTYDDANRMLTQAADMYKIGVVNVNIRSYYVEGSKTLGFEVAEQLGWKAPDHVIVPTASGALLCAIKKGFDELVKVGLLDDCNTKITAAQGAGCAPIVDAIKKRKDFITPIETPRTLAKSLAIGDPGDGIYALNTIKDSKGFAEDPVDQEIRDGIRLLAKSEGIYTEPAGGVSIAVLKRLIDDGNIDRDENVVCYVTGNGLKTPEAISSQLPKPIVVEPDIQSLAPILSR